jgi:hypothetical protein
LLFTIFVGVWAIVEGREQFAEEQRAQVHASFVVFRVYRTYSGGIKAHGMCTITNSGRGTATNIGMTPVRITADFGPREDSELATLAASERNRPLQAGEMLGPHAPPIEKMQMFMDVPPDCYVDAPGPVDGADPFRDTGPIIGGFNVSGCVRYRFKGAKRYHVVPFVRSVGFTAKDGGGEWHVDNGTQGTNVEPD